MKVIQMTKTEWSNMSKNEQSAFVADIFNRNVKSLDKMHHQYKKPINPGTVTPMYRIGEMSTCEVDTPTVNGSGPYKLVLCENVFDGSLSSHQINEGKVRLITVDWKNCVCRTHDGDLYLAEISQGAGWVKVTMTDQPDCIIESGKLISGYWPLFLSVYHIQSNEQTIVDKNNFKNDLDQIV